MSVKLTQEDFNRISTLQYQEGGGALLVYLDQRIAKDADHITNVDPNNAGAVGQLQGRMSAARIIKALLMAPVKALEKDEKETTN
jgi:hypothetical protein